MMAVRRYFLELAYKGTNYSGWQIQPYVVTLQEQINSVLTKLNHNIPINIVGCGRTDAGVHAKQFFAHFDFETIDDLKLFKFKMNNMLPKDIAIHQIFKVNENAHARFDATERTYHYHIITNKNPFLVDTSMLFTQLLDIDKMNQASKILLNYTDFECFSKVKTDVKNFYCTITRAEWIKTENGYMFVISANRFLRNMVRAIVGTLIEIGGGNLSIDDLHQIIKSKDRSMAGKSVISNGLFLAEIKYPYL
jgi:tRNA pseudouridine38-40 synthase